MKDGKGIIVKKDNTLVTAAYALGLAEQRMVLLAAATANSGNDPLSGLTLSAEQYAAAYKVTKQTAYEALKEACETLFERRITLYQNDKKTMTRWVSFVTYKEGEGAVELGFSPVIMPLFNNLQERFTVYALEQIADLTSIHAVRLYELLIQWRSTLKTPFFELEKFRETLGIEPSEYPRMTNFKQKVLDVAVKQINERTDILVQYEQHKKGRKIIGFSFSFKLKNAPKKVATTKPKRKQITKREAEQMARPGESWPQLLDRLKGEYWITDLESKPDTSDEG